MDSADRRVAVIPPDLVEFAVTQRGGRFILRSQNSGVVVGATLDEAIREARKIRNFCRYMDRKRAEEANQ